MIYNLYVKQHNQTGLKYLGSTTTYNPERYPGSGLYWKRHLDTYGNDVSTYIIATFDNQKDLHEAGLFYSNVWNIVESDEWANLKEEAGIEGGRQSEKTK